MSPGCVPSSRPCNNRADPSDEAHKHQRGDVQILNSAWLLGSSLSQQSHAAQTLHGEVPNRGMAVEGLGATTAQPGREPRARSKASSPTAGGETEPSTNQTELICSAGFHTLSSRSAPGAAFVSFLVSLPATRGRFVCFPTPLQFFAAFVKNIIPNKKHHSTF